MRFVPEAPVPVLTAAAAHSFSRSGHSQALALCLREARHSNSWCNPPRKTWSRSMTSWTNSYRRDRTPPHVAGGPAKCEISRVPTKCFNTENRPSKGNRFIPLWIAACRPRHRSAQRNLTLGRDRSRNIRSSALAVSCPGCDQAYRKTRFPSEVGILCLSSDYHPRLHRAIDETLVAPQRYGLSTKGQPP